MHVPANDGMEPDTAMFAQHDVADDNAGLFDKTGRGNGGFDSLKCADHEAHCRGIGLRPARGEWFQCDFCFLMNIAGELTRA